MQVKVPVIDQSHLGAKGFFYVGGSYKGKPGRQHMCGQMFVEVYVPKKVTQPYPIVFFHGAGQTNLNWLGTPDGREGWADYFVRQGYVVYLAEQPARGRSAYHAEDDGPRIYHPAEILQNRFASAEGNWSLSGRHTQWPEAGRTLGTEIFDQFAASQVEYLPSNEVSQRLVLAAAGPLLDKTGPAILLTHSQAGPFGWAIADAYPELVKGIVALEPSGPPFSRDLSNPEAKNYGLTDIPLHFSPKITAPSDFRLKLGTEHGPEEKDGWILEDSSLSLPALRGIPIVILVSEASYHAEYDYLTSQVMTQLGVQHDFVRLEAVGIRGNGHMMMLEKNNLDIAGWIHDWLQSHV